MTTSTPTSISIQPMTPDDTPATSALATKAFAHDPFHNASFPASMTAAQNQEYQLWRANLVKQRMAKPNAVYLKAVDSESGAIVGFAGFHGPSAAAAVTTKDGAGEGPRWPGAPSFLLGFEENAELFKRMRARVLGERGDVWFVQSMGVDPEFQGRGIARRLMDEGLKAVDESGLECYVEATPAAANLYAKSGFVLKDTVAVLDGTYVLSAMLRPAKKA